MPLRCSFRSGLDPGRSVPWLRNISYCCGVSCARHSASVFSISNFSAAGDGSEQVTTVKHHGLRARRAEWLAVKYGPHEEKLHGTCLDILTFLRASDSVFKRSALRFA